MQPLQLLLWQARLFVQALPQLPQFFGSIDTSTQAIGFAGSQCEKPEQHPPLHVWPAGHTTPHVPQFIWSLPRSTHEPEHWVRGALHSHAAFLQVALLPGHVSLLQKQFEGPLHWSGAGHVSHATHLTTTM
jgi:hypothetical protein